MPRKLKTYTTTSGFYDLAVAAPSMKAALEIWGSRSNLFHQGFAKQTDDAAITKATMEQPGTVLRRPVGTNGPFKVHGDVPKLSTLQSAITRRRVPVPPAEKAAKPTPLKKTDPAKARAVAKLYDLAQKRREREEERAGKLHDREEQRRAEAIEKAQTALENARALHEKRNAEIARERKLCERKERDEAQRWRDQKEKLEAALSRARKS